jgi:glutamate-1-semialdehyde aminotransferase
LEKNSYSISAAVGSENIMKKNATREIILDRGTYARNPVAVTAADASIDEIDNGHVHNNIVEFGKAIMKASQKF